MQMLKGIAANAIFVAGGLLLLLPISILSWLLEQAVKWLNAMGSSIGSRLPQPRRVFSDRFIRWFWLVLSVAFFLFSMQQVMVCVMNGNAWAMLVSLVQTMMWAVLITRTLEAWPTNLTMKKGDAGCQAENTSSSWR